jgi:ATP-dependent helicase/nuclease subunit A
MRTADDIPPQVRELQRAVAAPDVSAWVAANAGSGKTHVLAQRVINLLLDGVAPEKILCITFTKAAAANMAKRVFDTLAAWTTLDDDALDKAIREGSGLPSDTRRRTVARRLFARALETPGGLKVHTIHAFCTQLLHQFPFEANVAARFSVLDETQQSQLLEQLTLHVLLDGAREPDSDLGRALAVAMTSAADQTFRDVIRSAIGRRDAVTQWVVKDGGVPGAIAALSRGLGLDPSTRREDVEEEFFGDSLIAPSEWSEIAAALARGSKTDLEQARRFSLLSALPRGDRVETYLDIFCRTDDRAPRKTIATKAVKDEALIERLAAEQARVGVQLERLRAVICRDRSAALLTVAHAVLMRYHDEKERRGLLDYDDLIDKALTLLADVDAAWVHYKLDLGIDHLLIDEAQDTSHKQWQIVTQLVAEFTAGAGVHIGTRTIFAVGDEKQSIYSFQNAAPREFAQMRGFFQRAHSHAGIEFLAREFKHSFRSGANVLAAVDEVFKDALMAASVSSDTDGFPPHIALPDAPPSLVEVWEPIEPEPRKEMEGWDAPFDTVSETSPRVKLAKRIGRTVRRLVETGAPVGIDRRPARYGDILILVRQRGELFEAIIRALKHEHVEVAGADRLILTEHIAVMDLMALADALLLPQDDLALATVLRSPLFGFSDEDLFTVAYDHDRISLREALARKAGDGELFAAAAHARLEEWSQAARRETPFSFYAKILGADGARHHFLGRLGAEANDAIDEFLNLAIDYERRETPSLQGFMAWLREARAEVKRDMEIARDEVRVMTVHGAKGLEAPIVFLADTMTPPAGPRPPRLLELAGKGVIWVGRKADDPPPIAAARQDFQREATDEYRRLLYVAMTRAADRLIICGAEGERRRPDGCWYDLICEPLKPLLVEETEGEDKVFRYRTAESPVAEPAKAPELAPQPDEPETPTFPKWLRDRVPPRTAQRGPIAPSSAFDEDFVPVAQRGPSAAARRKALERGRIVHRLMQSLPDIAPDRRAEACAHFLTRAAAKDFSAAEKEEITKQVTAILDDQRFAEIFLPNSRAEVPIVGQISRSGAEPLGIAGQVDRLCVGSDSVLIADYKTDGVVPRNLEDVPHYVTQLALYRAVLARLYPDKSVRAALVFTSGPVLMEIPGASMDAALSAELGKVVT